MVQRDLNVVLKTGNSIFCSSSPKIGLCNTEEGCLLGETRMWQMAEEGAGARPEWVFFLPVLKLGYTTRGSWE